MRTEQVTKSSEPLQKLRVRLGTWVYVIACYGVRFLLFPPSVCLDDI